MKEKLLLVCLCCCLSLSTLYAQKERCQQDSNVGKALFISTKPQTLLFGPNLGIELQASRKVSIGADLTAHLWAAPAANIAIAPHIRYFFGRGSVGKGFYAQLKLVVGHILERDIISGPPYYAGGGLGLGAITPIFGSRHWHLFANVGLKAVAPFGTIKREHRKDDGFSMAYYALMSPASIPDLNIGIAFRF